ncbi:TapB family protein [Pinibacter aurantiacus]|uniref:DUF3108 domain-containing protein n=1 Tax=Pinibacter aurantiacus TaxID=2851599 RepID=A0A9E2W2C5_9BACT|nr:hypothetical protein [Pinibacter aurantiacus]MBV4357180.1 hypothetical protein [Pinibacter aurantiacus]
MKTLITVIILSLGITLNAQDNSKSILFKKGAELEYRTYDLKPGALSKKDFFEITRLIFKVLDVRDSNNIKYSYISKKGINPNNAKQTYEKKYVITCDGNKISIPLDFYTPDTVYFSNVYPTVTKDKGIQFSVNYIGASFYKFPTDFKKNKFLIEGDAVTVSNTVRDFETAFTQDGTPKTTARIIEFNRDANLIIKKCETKGEENITTERGDYESSKIVIAAELEVSKRRLPTTWTLFYNPEVGLVKFEAEQSKRMLSYTELVRVKK